MEAHFYGRLGYGVPKVLAGLALWLGGAAAVLTSLLLVSCRTTAMYLGSERHPICGWFDDEHLAVCKKGRWVKFPWSRVEKVKFSPAGLSIKTDFGIQTFFPRRAAATHEDWERIRNLALEHVQKQTREKEWHLL